MKNKINFEVTREKSKYSWTAKSSNGRIVGKSHKTYSRRDDCENNAARHGMPPMHYDHADQWNLRHQDKWEIIREDGKYTWNRLSANGRIIGESTKAFSRRIDCVANATMFGFDEKTMAVAA